MNPVVARYPGTCVRCDEPIEVGQGIVPVRASEGYGADAWRHAGPSCPVEEPERPGYLAPKTSVDEMGY